MKSTIGLPAMISPRLIACSFHCPFAIRDTTEWSRCSRDACLALCRVCAARRLLLGRACEGRIAVTGVTQIEGMRQGCRKILHQHHLPVMLLPERLLRLRFPRC